ncbi:MAG TPA: aminotransferase class V-fold PLP-dependent enzyme, partial [Candidatus Dormibacteraeota bacterium]|nr:aminotransferase class V-fold PLP-dependent enzyme [Candidatus Dormibacteraeota bacterium]
VRAWASGRAVELWAGWESDLVAFLPEVAASLADAREDGVRLAILVPDERPRPWLAGIADFTVVAEPAPSPFGLFGALRAAGIPDVRRLGVLGASRTSLEAGHAAGAGAIVGLAAHGDGRGRRGLLPAQPDVVVEPSGLGALDAERYASARRHRERVLLNPGPAVVSDRIHRAVAGPDLCHREPEYTELFARVRSKLLGVAGVGDDWAVALIGGSGTAAMEAMTGTCTRPGRKLLVCRNGIYGDRIATIAERLGIEVVSIRAAHTEPIDPAAVATALDADPAIDAVAVIHHETTTGLLNPVHEIAREAHRRGVLTVVDAISSFGSEPLDVRGSGIDIVAGTANKNLHGLPGVAFLILSPRAQERANAVPPRSLYFDIPNYLRAQARSTVPFTPAIPAIYGLEAALDELGDEGIQHRVNHYRERMDYLDAEFARLGLEPIVAPAHRSGSVRSLPLPAGVTYDVLHDAVKADGFVIYAGLGEAAATNFRVCALGALEIPALEAFIASLERAIGWATPVAASPVTSQA